MTRPNFAVSGVIGIFFALASFVVLSTPVEAAFGVRLYADKDVIKPGESAAIDWTISYGSTPAFPYSCTGSFGNFSVTTSTGSGYASGNFPPVSPTTNTTYTVSCTGAGSTSLVTGTKQIIVSSKPVVRLSANPTTLPVSGGSAMISWDVDLATSCTATDGDARWRGLGGLEGGGNLSWTLTTTTTFSLECFDATGQSSGKKSVQVYVGASCGNAVVDAGEDCDEGASNSDACDSTSTCSSRCTMVLSRPPCSGGDDPVCGNDVVEPTVDHQAYSGETCDDGSDNGACPALCNPRSCTLNSCAGGMTVRVDAGGDGAFGDPGYVARGTGMDLGSSMFVSFEVANAVSCSSSGFDGLESASSSDPLPKSSGTFSGAGYLTPTAVGTYTVSITCTDRYNQTLTRSDSFSVGNDRTPRILSFTATPSTVPFSSAGQVVFDWSGENLGTCSIAGATPPSVTGDSGSTQITYPLSARRVSSKEVVLVCRNGSEDEDARLFVYFQSDPNQAPQVSLKAYLKKPDGTRGGQTTSIPGPYPVQFELEYTMNGAERCEASGWLYRQGAYEGTSVPPIVGSAYRPLIFTEENTYGLECWNGELSTKATLTITARVDPPDDDDNGDGDGGPTDNSKCDVGTPKASCNDATEEVVGRTKDGTGVCCQARTGVEAVLYTIPISNPLAFNTVDELLTSLWGFLQAIIVILSLIMIVIGSIVYMTAGGNDSKLSTGKLIITASLIGLALALAAPSFLKEIGAILGWGAVDGSPADSAKSITEILTGILNFLLSVIGIIGIIMVVIGGLMYLTAAGDEDRIKTGKSIVKYSLIGIIVALAALVIISQITKFFG